MVTPTFATRSDIPFSVKSLLETGFEDNLIELGQRAGYGNAFFEALISTLTVGSRLKKTSIGGVDVFCKTAGWFAFPDVIEHIVERQGEPMGIDELCKRLDDEHGIDLGKSVVRYSVRRASLAYDEESDSVRRLAAAD